VNRAVASALAAGCTVVVRPSEFTPRSALDYARAFVDAGLPPGVLNVINGDPASMGQAMLDDARCRKIAFTGSTRVGKLLRRTAVDELPQLWHVLRGEMSLIGPRPVPLPHLERYDERQKRRLEVRPGLTGWAQVHGRASLPWPERLELDVWYVEHQSLSLDARILAKTAGVLLRRDVVYRGEAGGWR